MFSSRSYRLEKEMRLLRMSLSAGPDTPPKMNMPEMNDKSLFEKNKNETENKNENPLEEASTKISKADDFIGSMGNGLNGEASGLIEDSEQVQPELRKFQDLLPAKKESSENGSIDPVDTAKNVDPAIQAAVDVGQGSKSGAIDKVTTESDTDPLVQAAVDIGQGAETGALNGLEKSTAEKPDAVQASVDVGQDGNSISIPNTENQQQAEIPNAAEGGAEDVDPAAIEGETEKEAPKTRGEQIEQSLNSALDTLKDPDATASQKMIAAVQALGAMKALLEGAYNGTLDEPQTSESEQETGTESAESKEDENTSERRERLQKDVEKRGYDEVLQSKERSKERIADMNKEVNELEDEAGRLDDKIDADKDKIKDLQQEKANARDEDKADVQDRIDTIEGRIRMNQKMIDAIEERREDLLSKIADKQESVQEDIDVLKNMKKEQLAAFKKATDVLKEITESLPEEAGDLRDVLSSIRLEQDSETLSTFIDKPSIGKIAEMAGQYDVDLDDGWSGELQGVLTVLQEIASKMSKKQEKAGIEKGGSSEQVQEDAPAKENTEKESEISVELLNAKAQDYIANMVGEQPGVRSAIEVSDLGNGLVELRIDKGLIETRAGVSNAANLYQLLSQPLTSGEINQETNVLTIRVTAPQLLKNLDEIQERNIRNNRRGQIS